MMRGCLQVLAAIMMTASCGQILPATGDASSDGIDSQPKDANVDSAPGSQSVTLLFDDFLMPLDPAKWATSFTAGAANVYVDAQSRSLILETIPNTACASAEANGLAQATIISGRRLIFDSILAAYADQSLYGDHQPRGLRAGIDGNNALEFVSANPAPNNITCRSVWQGMVTETTVNIEQPVNQYNTYRIEVNNLTANFYVNGRLVCSHTTNIPINIALNPFFSTSDGCAGNVPQTIDKVEFDLQ